VHHPQQLSSHRLQRARTRAATPSTLSSSGDSSSGASRIVLANPVRAVSKECTNYVAIKFHINWDNLWAAERRWDLNCLFLAIIKAI
jgi:hypothetical protein